ncbi:MAG: substrate-binding domain-containing protein [Bacteroidota bacterium]
MRQRLIFLFCLVFVNFKLGFAQTGTDKSSQKKITIGLIGRIAANPVFIAEHSGALLAAKELGLKYKIDVVIDWETPEDENVQEQAVAIERLIRSGASGIAIACSDENYLTPVINEAVEKGIPVMCYDSDAPKSKRFAYYGADDIEFGKAIMRQLAGAIKGKGTIAVLAGNANALNQQLRLKGINEELKKYPDIKLPESNIFHSIEIADLSAEMVRREQNSNPNIAGWIFLSSRVFQSKNPFPWKPGEVKITGGNAVPVQLDYIKSGYAQSFITSNYFEKGYKSVEILLDKIVKNKAPKQPLMYCPIIIVTEKNVNEWSLNWNKWLVQEGVSH